MGEVEGRYSGQWYSLSLLNGEMKAAEAETTLNSFLRFLPLASLIA